MKAIVNTDKLFLDEYKACVDSINPSKIINRKIELQAWKITYKYKTNRGNTNFDEKFIFLPRILSLSKLVEKQFEQDMEDFNNNNPHRAISNVKILGINCMGNVDVELS